MLLVEACPEYNLPLWMCTVDYTKAFDSVEHNATWKARWKHGVDMQCIRSLAHLYKQQVGFNNAGSTLSRPYNIHRSTKQGDGLSPALFNSVFEEVLKLIQPAWRRKGYSVRLRSGTKDILTNLRFADALLLVGSSEKQIRHMLQDLISASSEVGL